MIKIKIKNSIIAERLTDKFYGAISHYIYELLLDENRFTARAQIYGTNDGTGYIPSITIYFTNATLSNLNYKKYQDATGDDSIIKNVQDLKEFLYKLDITILPRFISPGAAGDMSSRGKMRIFLPNWNPKPVSEEELKPIKDYIEIKPEEAEKVWGERERRNIEKALDGAKAGRFAKYIEDVLSHEIGHYINAFRSSRKDFKPKDFRAKGGEKQFKIGTKEYARSTEEWQARFTEALFYIRKALKIQLPDLESDLKKKNDWYQEVHLDQDWREMERSFEKKYADILKSSGIPDKVVEALVSIQEEDFSTFYFAIKDLTNFDYYEPRLNKNIKKRIDSRIYSLYNDLKDKKDERFFKIFKFGRIV